MNARRVHVVLLAALAAAGCGGGAVDAPWTAAPDAAVALRVDVAPKQVALLGPVTVTLDRWRKQGVEVAFAPQVDEKDFLTQSSQTAAEVPLAGGLWQRTTLVLLPITGPGERTIPSFRAEAAAADGAEPVVATTPEVAIRVTSTLADAGPAIEAPGEPFDLTASRWPFYAAGAALAALAWLWHRRRARRPARQHVEVPVPAHVTALRELERLRRAPRTTDAEIERYYVDVSQVLRVYLEQRFGLRAPERTTEEFLRDLEGGDRLAQRHREELERFLSQCDLVKFAAVVPTAAEHETTWQLAHAFVESTRADAAPSPAAPQEVSA